MPLGVEHGRQDNLHVEEWRVILALMPLGVEHTLELVFMRKKVKSDPRIDAVRR